MESLGEALPKEQARVRELIITYRSLGPSGFFAAYMMEESLKKADQAVITGDVVTMITVFQELKGYV